MMTAFLNRMSWDRHIPSGGTSSEEPLKVLRREYPDLAQMVMGKSVLDFGCGYGEQSRALAEAYGCVVTGYDNNPRVLDEARKKPAQRVRFVESLDAQQYDVVVSLNAMEHFSDPKSVLDQMARVVRPDGVLLVTFGPPWYAPFGSHMHFFCAVPWLNLLFPESVVMKVRERFWQDGARRYEEVEGGLNRMSLRKFERLLRREDLRVERRNYTAVKRVNTLTRIPVIRELITNHVTVVLRHSGR